MLFLVTSFLSCDTQDVPDVEDTTPAPSFMDPTSDTVSGVGCAWTPEDYQTNAGLLVHDRWELIDSLQIGDATLRSPDDFQTYLDDSDDFHRQWAALAATLSLERAEVFGIYSRLADATLLDGELTGITAGEALDATASGDDEDLRYALTQFNSGFGGCNYSWYLIDDTDIDNDGVGESDDCDDLDPLVGTLLYESDLSSDDGEFNPTEHLGESWEWDGNSVYATDGGQEVMLGSEAWTDTVVIGELSSQGTEPGCGFDCLSECGDYTPDDDCWTDYQALALGILSFEITGVGVATLTNSDPDYDICLEGFAMWDNPGSQSLVVGEEVLLGSTYRIPAGSSLDMYYASWTTDNGVYSPYLDEPSFWCYQYGTTLAVGDSYDSIGAWLPEDIQAPITDDTDEDGDGVEDHVDWAGASGVQAQANIWTYQNSHAAVAIGKLAESTSSGTVEVTLTVQNRGATATTATVTDTLPAFWSLDSCDDTPDSEGTNSDEQVELTWSVALDGCTDSCSTIDEHVITCEIRYNLNADLNFVELPQATADYNDGDDDETSSSMNAAAFDYDWNSDGDILCGETERWRAGFLSRAATDDDQDEGYHGYRCALASNSVLDCWDAGHFLQIAAFLDVEEDDINSECEGSCINPSFDQLARTDHDESMDLATGSDATIRFYTFEDDLYCYATDGTVEVKASATADYFADAGVTGMSTLNMYGDFDSIKVCEAYGVPE
ncbi:MAG TPA: hypothetical protein QGF58_27095 [Myxococcota bacterium]|nr:hypothetical protein [Myxococcota bacterium]